MASDGRRSHPMIAFATLILGLVLGVRPVELTVGDEVARVELLLDGQRVALLEAPPWRSLVDFGSTLEPHRLTAVAFDQSGGETARIEQWLNLPRSEAEAQLVVEGLQGDGPPIAHLSWKSILGTRPRRVRVELDGQPIPTKGRSRIELPPLDPEQLHFLRAEVEFSSFLSATAEITFGGVFADQVSAQLTGVPLEIADPQSPPTVDDLNGKLLAGDGSPLRVVAVEAGPAEVVVVRDSKAAVPLRKLGRQFRRQERETAAAGGGRRGLGEWIALEDDSDLTFLWPYSINMATNRSSVLFPSSEPVDAARRGLFRVLAEQRPPPAASGAERLADATAVAGMTAARRDRRRAVLLLVGSDHRDHSALNPSLTRHFLSSLGVPLFVWSLADGAHAESWSPSFRVTDPPSLEQATAELVDSLARQRIAWVEGTHLPQSIRLAPGAHGLSLLR